MLTGTEHLPCGFTAQLDRYLSEQDAQQRYQDEVDEIAEQLLATTYSPHTAVNMIEALGNMCDEEIERFLVPCTKGDNSKALVSYIAEYWNKSAHDKAELIIEKRKREYAEHSYELAHHV